MSDPLAEFRESIHMIAGTTLGQYEGRGVEPSAARRADLDAAIDRLLLHVLLERSSVPRIGGRGGVRI